MHRIGGLPLVVVSRTLTRVRKMNSGMVHTAETDRVLETPLEMLAPSEHTARLCEDWRNYVVERIPFLIVSSNTIPSYRVEKDRARRR